MSFPCAVPLRNSTQQPFELLAHYRALATPTCSSSKTSTAKQQACLLLASCMWRARFSAGSFLPARQDKAEAEGEYGQKEAVSKLGSDEDYQSAHGAPVEPQQPASIKKPVENVRKGVCCCAALTNTPSGGFHRTIIIAVVGSQAQQQQANQQWVHL